MEKILKPKENYNTHKLSVELKNAEIENCIWIYDDHLKIKFEPKDETVVEQIIFSHTPEPTPLPEPKSEMELLGEKVELLDGTLTEVLFNIIPTLQGGV